MSPFCKIGLHNIQLSLQGFPQQHCVQLASNKQDQRKRVWKMPHQPDGGCARWVLVCWLRSTHAVMIPASAQ